MTRCSFSTTFSFCEYDSFWHGDHEKGGNLFTFSVTITRVTLQV